MPIKWLALESITERTFNTRTDVWSFGIFMWELFSLAAVPYPGIPIKDLVVRLQEGYRMSRPKYATQDIYDIMLSCWLHSAPRRPTFPELSSQLLQYMPKKEVSITNCLVKGHNRFLFFSFISFKDAIEKFNNEYLEPYIDHNFRSVLACFGENENNQQESIPMQPFLNGYSQSDCDNLSAPRERAPSAPVTSPQHTNDSRPRHLKKTQTKPTAEPNTAISNPCYIPPNEF